MPGDARETARWAARERLLAALTRAERAGKIIPCRRHDANPEAWFRPGLTSAEARELCRGCPVLKVCRSYGHVARERVGVWGGVARGATGRRRRVSNRVPNRGPVAYRWNRRERAATSEERAS